MCSMEAGLKNASILFPQHFLSTGKYRQNKWPRANTGQDLSPPCSWGLRRSLLFFPWKLTDFTLQITLHVSGQWFRMWGEGVGMHTQQRGLEPRHLKDMKTQEHKNATLWVGPDSCDSGKGIMGYKYPNAVFEFLVNYQP